MRSDDKSALGVWRIETSQSRFLPLQGGLRLSPDGEGFVLDVTWKDADAPAKLQRAGGKLDLAQGRARLVFDTPNGETHRLVAAVHAEPGQRRRLFGFVASNKDREETGTGAWTAVEEDPDNDGDLARPTTAGAGRSLSP